MIYFAITKKTGIIAHINGVSPSGKAAGFDPAIRRFEPFYPRVGLFVKSLTNLL